MRSPYEFACVRCAARCTPNCSASKLRDGKQAMLYKYDQLNRITKSRSLAFGNGNYAARSNEQKYDEDYSYDANGNILTLKRRDDKAAVMDDFNYSYYSNSNKLLKHKAAGGAYEYDAIGNLVKDNNENLSIAWTPSGKVRSVVKPDTTVYFRYDAMGNRIAKIVSTASKSDTTAYVRDASGNVMTVYDNRTAAEAPIYGSSRIGEYMGKEKEGYQTFNLRKYELTNHLGNVLAVISDKVNLYGHDNRLDSARATVMSASDYYPFGLPMRGRQFNEKNFRYGFNGKEKDNEFGWQDYGERMYLQRIGRFPSPDPLIIYKQKYPELSSYQFASNTPIQAIDLDGLEAFFSINGTKIRQLGSSTQVRVVDQNQIKQFNKAKPDAAAGMGRAIGMNQDELYMRATLTVLKAHEGGKGQEAYNTWIGGEKFKLGDTHPGGNAQRKTAAGAYQIMQKSWDDKNTGGKIRSKYKIADFSETSQDKFAVGTIKDKLKAYDEITAGNIRGALGKLSNEWRALPGPKSQSSFTIEAFLGEFKAGVSNELQGKSDIATKKGELLKDFNK